MNNILLIISAAIIARLSAIDKIKEQVVGIFTHVPANSKFPYIHLGKIELKEHSSKTQSHYEAVVNIAVYSRDRNCKSLFNIVDQIKSVMIVNQILIEGCNLLSLVCLSCEIDQKPDGLTSFANIKYKLLLGV